jgi:hypothetical protein
VISSATSTSSLLFSTLLLSNLCGTGLSNFSEVEFHPNLLLCWLAGDTAAIADELDDEEVG